MAWQQYPGANTLDDYEEGTWTPAFTNLDHTQSLPTKWSLYKNWQYGLALANITVI
jgi:hypothetical protein